MQLQGNRIMWQLSALLAFSVVHTHTHTQRTHVPVASHFPFLTPSFLHQLSLCLSTFPPPASSHFRSAACCMHAQIPTHMRASQNGALERPVGAAPGLDNAALAPYTAIDEATNW